MQNLDLKFGEWSIGWIYYKILARENDLDDSQIFERVDWNS
jgi:hypothetical protein